MNHEKKEEIEEIVDASFEVIPVSEAKFESPKAGEVIVRDEVGNRNENVNENVKNAIVPLFPGIDLQNVVIEFKDIQGNPVNILDLLDKVNEERKRFGFPVSNRFPSKEESLALAKLAGRSKPEERSGITALIPSSVMFAPKENAISSIDWAGTIVHFVDADEETLLPSLIGSQSGQQYDKPSDLSARKRLRYSEINPFSRWNKWVDKQTQTESWSNQISIHQSRFASIFAAYKAFFLSIPKIFSKKERTFHSFEDAMATYGILESEIPELIAARKKQVIMFCLIAFIMLASSIYFWMSNNMVMVFLDIFMFVLMSVIAVVFNIELWRLKNRRLGGFKDWLMER